MERQETRPENEETIKHAVREQPPEARARDSRARAAAEQLLALADRGPYFTDDAGEILREELHERNRNSAEQIE